MRILITGATGFVGMALGKKLLQEGKKLTILTRNKEKIPNIYKDPNVNIIEWRDTNLLPPKECTKDIIGVINLMGENIAAKNWSEAQKKILTESRVNATENLISTLENNLESPLEFFISASAIGIYPTNLSDQLNEDSSFGNGFLADLCKSWEKSALKIQKTKRIVIIRTSVVLDKHGGALKKMLPPFLLGLGGPIGDGLQYMSWIHLDDLVNIYSRAIEDNTFQGVYNACAPYPVTNKDFTKALATAIKRPAIFPLPKFVLKSIFQEMSSVILDSQKIISGRLVINYFNFTYPTISEAMNKIFEKK